MVQALVCALPAAPQQGGPPACVQGAQGRRPPFRITWQASSEPRRPGKVEPAGTPYPSVNDADASPPSRDRKFRTEQLCRRILLRIVFPGSCFGLKRAQRGEGRAKKRSRRGPARFPKRCSARGSFLLHRSQEGKPTARAPRQTFAAAPAVLIWGRLSLSSVLPVLAGPSRCEREVPRCPGAGHRRQNAIDLVCRKGPRLEVNPVRAPCAGSDRCR